MDKQKTARETQVDESKSRHAVVHYAEIGLKGRNRPFFERTLAQNVARRLEHLGVEVEEVERLPLEMALIDPRPALVRYGITFVVPPIAGLLAEAVVRLL